MVYNTHSLVHLCQDVKNWGTLHRFSAYPFESFLGKLKSALRKPNFPLSQIVTTLLACTDNKTDFISVKPQLKTNILKRGHSDGPTLTTGPSTQFRRLDTPQFSVILKSGNNVLLTRSRKVILVRNIIQDVHSEITLAAQTFQVQDDFYDVPYKSSVINIYKVKCIDSSIKTFKLCDIMSKMCVIPTEEPETFVVIPLAHTA
jgi:hypothetical protein